MIVGKQDMDKCGKENLPLDDTKTFLMSYDW